MTVGSLANDTPMVRKDWVLVMWRWVFRACPVMHTSLWLLIGQCTSGRARQLCLSGSVGVGVTMCESLGLCWCDCVCICLGAGW